MEDVLKAHVFEERLSFDFVGIILTGTESTSRIAIEELQTNLCFSKDFTGG